MKHILTLTLSFLVSNASPTELAVELIKNHEGYKSSVYRDSTGHPTIGWGTNLSYVTKVEAEFLLLSRLSRVDSHLSETYPWYDGLPYMIRSCLQDVVYNVGPRSFSKFRKLHIQLERGNWVKSALELKDSLWYRQTGVRSKYIYDLIRNYK